MISRLYANRQFDGGRDRRAIQSYSKRVLDFIISWHSLRTTYVSRSVELEMSQVVVMGNNTGDSPATILKCYANLPEVVMRRFVEIPYYATCAPVLF
jgi:hypothetical protein